jgi:hypothetical protein
MGRHRFDDHNGDKWGGPELVSARDSQQSVTQSIGGENPILPRPAGNDDQVGASVELT